MKYFKFLIPLLVVACNTEKVILLPEVQQVNTHEVLDISPAYLFYDSTAVNSIELNRKNLIISTNWLVNVDRRLTLKQVIPRIQFLQNKKRGAEMHKNEDAKNYYSCNDTRIKNLGFIDFTDVNYFTKDSVEATQKALNKMKTNRFNIKVETLNRIKFSHSEEFKNLNQLISELQTDSTLKSEPLVLYLAESLTFQDYMSIKSALISVISEGIQVHNNEFIY
ncbi:MAG: hypothetical protein CMC55_03595 [Flavobacteriaceae bacterium]|uniref:hypothetical protein n=1 Tax=Bizionia echini TaxID=649333 RepID=UPI000C8B00BC|nr:hypothetical protein [Flavobacteriaceae bacterium]